MFITAAKFIACCPLSLAQTLLLCLSEGAQGKGSQDAEKADKKPQGQRKKQTQAKG